MQVVSSFAAISYEFRYSSNRTLLRNNFFASSLVTEDMIRGGFDLSFPKHAGETEYMTMIYPPLPGTQLISEIQIKEFIIDSTICFIIFIAGSKIAALAFVVHGTNGASEMSNVVVVPLLTPDFVTGVKVISTGLSTGNIVAIASLVIVGVLVPILIPVVTCWCYSRKKTNNNGSYTKHREENNENSSQFKHINNTTEDTESLSSNA